MRVRGRGATALVALLLFMVSAACRDTSSDDRTVAYSSDDVQLPQPELKVMPGGAWRLSASFTWRTCGERACWTLDDGHHGGPDVFGVYLTSGPRIAVQSVKLTLRSSCGEQRPIGDAVTGEAGVFFLVQEATGKKGGCRRFKSERDFNMASGTMEAVVTPVAGTACQGILSVNSMFGHSYADGGRDVKVNAGQDSSRPRIDWGANESHQFQAVTANPGLYDCSGTEESP